MEYEEFRKVIKELKINMKDFSILANTSYLTVRNWGKNGRAVPSWVQSWLNLYIRNKELEELKNEEHEKYNLLAKALKGVMSEESSQQIPQ